MNNANNEITALRSPQSLHEPTMLSTCTRRSQFRLRVASALNRIIERKIQTDLDRQTAEFRAEELRAKFEATAAWLNPDHPGSTANRCPEGRRAAAQCRWSRVRQDAEQSSDIAAWDDLIDQSPRPQDFVAPWNRPHMQSILENWLTIGKGNNNVT